jgi:hypothetical protein
MAVREQARIRSKQSSMLDFLPSRRYAQWRALPVWPRVFFWGSLGLALATVLIAFGQAPDTLKALFFACVVVFCAACGVICREWGKTLWHWVWFGLSALALVRLILLLTSAPNLPPIP